MSNDSSSQSPVEQLEKINFTELVKSVQLRLMDILASTEKINSLVESYSESDQSKQIIQSVADDMDHILFKLEEIDYYLN